MRHSQLWVSSLLLLLLAKSQHALRTPEKNDYSVLQTSVFLSPPFFLRPGSVANEFLFNIPFPRGHIALKSFDAEVVDENGVPVPLHETYLHHWVIERYYGEKATQSDHDLSKIILARNSGVCEETLGQYFGLGSETRKTSTWVPEPFGIEVGDPKKIPSGYEERWLLNIHAIDTRGVKDRSGCTECKCSLYNVTVDEFGHPLRKDYIGGLLCCYDKTRCQLRDGFNGAEARKLYLRYTVKWARWDESIVPVKIYIFDVTDTGKVSEGQPSSCKVEYRVDSCAPEVVQDGECLDTRKTSVVIPRGGDIVYGVAHQHSGGLGSALYGQDGRDLCTSVPTYGNGEEAGNEDGYIVGMSTCYPKPGSVKVADGETLTLVSNYSSAQMHTGVMGLFYILVAGPQAPPKSRLLFHDLTLSWREDLREYWWAFLVVGVIAVVIIRMSYSRKNGEGYQSL
ncbi:uncharacterized protein A4U43_C04F16080 [Asparagus officinalis]|uniref:Stress up-regulated Nod 19 protein n=1 Tax=Asparagus officinalis TaxID=4686 RepID=A0A5P1F635_ASPOF|nr:uncharacterized protein LOC109837392 isoform X1 [Asparagus officinalis]ONK72131.1 uncharacterized protein A4U43_C04F16080 [Asparagus officinalis]